MPTPARRPAPVSALDVALHRVGDRWSLLLVEALLGGPRRFGELLGDLDGLAPNILSSRLKALEAEGLLAARPYSTRPRRVAYVLTASGAELAGALRLLAQWGAVRSDHDADRRCTMPRAAPRSRRAGGVPPAPASWTRRRTRSSTGCDPLPTDGDDGTGAGGNTRPRRVACPGSSGVDSDRALRFDPVAVDLFGQLLEDLRRQLRPAAAVAVGGADGGRGEPPEVAEGGHLELAGEAAVVLDAMRCRRCSGSRRCSRAAREAPRTARWCRSSRAGSRPRGRRSSGPGPDPGWCPRQWRAAAGPRRPERSRGVRRR